MSELFHPCTWMSCWYLVTGWFRPYISRWNFRPWIVGEITQLTITIVNRSLPWVRLSPPWIPLPKKVVKKQHAVSVWTTTAVGGGPYFFGDVFVGGNWIHWVGGGGHVHLKFCEYENRRLILPIMLHHISSIIGCNVQSKKKLKTMFMYNLYEDVAVILLDILVMFSHLYATGGWGAFNSGLLTRADQAKGVL